MFNRLVQRLVGSPSVSRFSSSVSRSSSFAAFSGSARFSRSQLEIIAPSSGQPAGAGSGIERSPTRPFSSKGSDVSESVAPASAAPFESKADAAYTPVDGWSDAFEKPQKFEELAKENGTLVIGDFFGRKEGMIALVHAVASLKVTTIFLEKGCSPVLEDEALMGWLRKHPDANLDKIPPDLVKRHFEKS